MKKRTKISLVAMSLCLVIALGVLGIFAVKTLNMSVGGNITFTADGILASISKGTMAGGSFVTPADADTKMKAVEVTTNKTETELNAELASWQGLNLAFAQSGADVTITFTIKNNSTQANSYIDVKTTINNGTAVNAFADVSPSWVVIDPGATQTFVITLSVITTEINASLTDFVVGFALSKTNTKTQTTNLSFDVGEAGNAANFPTTSYEVGSVIEQLDAPNVTNKTFEGWYTDSALTQKIEFPFTITADTKLYAKYIEGTLMPASYKYDAASDSYHIVRNTTAGYTYPEIVVIPDEYNGPNGRKPVTKIVDGTTGSTVVFGLSTTIKEAYIGNNVTYIGGMAFRQISSLEKVVIPDSVVEMSDVGYQFTACSKLRDITLSKNITSIPVAAFAYTAVDSLDFLTPSVKATGKQAFSGCNNFVDITIPQTLIEIGPFLFSSSENLVNVNMHSKMKIPGGDPYYKTPFGTSSINKIGTYYDVPNSKVLIKADPTITDTSQIPGYETITHIGITAFMKMDTTTNSVVANTSLTTINFPSLKEVGACAFYNCQAVTTANIGQAEKIGENAFYNCKEMTTMDISSVKYIEKQGLYDCLKYKLTIPSGLVWAGDLAFDHCSITDTNQTTLTIPASVVQLGGTEFIGPNNENNIIGSAVFYNCETKTLTEFIVDPQNPYFVTHEGVLYTKDYKYFVAYPSAKTDTSYTIPEGCVDMFEMSFGRTHFLKNLTIPNSLIIRSSWDYPDNIIWKGNNSLNGAFYKYCSVANVLVKADNTKYKSVDGILYSYDGKSVLCIPTAHSRLATLTLSNDCENIEWNPILYVASQETYNGQEIGKHPTEIVIGANIKNISDAALESINSYGWTITCNSAYFTVNADGDLVRV